MVLATPALAAVDFGRGVENAWSSVVTFVPKLLAFLVVLLIGWLVAKAVATAVEKVLERVGFDRFVRRGGLHRVLAKGRYDASDILARLAYYAVLLITLQVAFGVFGPNPVSVVLTGIVAWLPRAAVAIVIVVVAGAIARAGRDVVGNALSGLSYGSLLGTLAAVFVWGLGIIAALNQIGVATSVTTPVLVTVLATVAGVVIVGVGGGLVRPMQQRWEQWLDRAEREIPQARAAAEAYQRGREDADRAMPEPVAVPAGAASGRYRQEPAFMDELGFEQEPGFRQGSGFQQDSAYQQDRAFQQEPAFQQDRAYQQEPAFQQGSGFQGAPGFRQEPGFQQDPGFQQESVFQQELAYQQEPALRQDPGFQQEPAFQEDPAFRHDPALQQEPAFQGELGYPQPTYRQDPGHQQGQPYRQDPGYQQEQTYRQDTGDQDPAHRQPPVPPGQQPPHQPR